MGEGTLFLSSFRRYQSHFTFIINTKHNLSSRKKKKIKIFLSEVLPRTRALSLHHMKTYHKAEFKKPRYQQGLTYMLYCFIMYLYYVP